MPEGRDQGRSNFSFRRLTADGACRKEAGQPSFDLLSHTENVMPPEPLITWSEPILQLTGFIAQFLAAGAIGFRFFAMNEGTRD